MILPISVGTLLRNRYLIQQVLGQGGFGRTYLALDQERFNESCVLKEFVVPYQDEALVAKSKTLFQREASILYLIQHPQVPRFWAAFEDDQRLFLVQDYVAGQTYRRLLSDRKQHGHTFSEAEVLHFLSHMLPVLTYIHDRDIVHRDITPENIILRTQSTTELKAVGAGSGLPVLIDFGAVKEATSHWPLVSSATRVGKIGYAPLEQLQTGKVYPNSDLYALAATALTLLTGKEPQALLDSQTLSWQWQAYAIISEPLAEILHKMLSMYAGDRYQSASEVLTALQPLLHHGPTSTLLPSPAKKAAASAIRNQHRARTNPQTDQRSEPIVAYSSPPQSTPSSSLEAASQFTSYPTEQHPRPNNKLRLGIAASILVGLGIATPILWRAQTGSSDPNGDVWVSGARMPQSEASRILESQTRAAIQAPGTPEAENGGQSNQPPLTIQFPPGKISTVLRGTLPNNALQPYILEGSEGQIMTATLEGSGVAMNLLRSNDEAIDAAAYQTNSWTGQLPTRDRYLIQVTGSGSYSLEVAMTPLSRPTQEQTQRVTFARGNTGTTVTGQILPRQVRRYLLKAKRGQILALNVLQGNVVVSAIAPNGQRIGGSATTSKKWQGRLPADGDFVIEISSKNTSDYALSFEIF